MENPPDYIAFTSAAEVEGFIELMGLDSACDLAGKSNVATLSGSVAATARKHGLPVDVEASFSSAEDFINALVNHSQGHEKV